MFHKYRRLSASPGQLFQYDVRHINIITIILPSKHHDHTDWLAEVVHVWDLSRYIIAIYALGRTLIYYTSYRNYNHQTLVSLEPTKERFLQGVRVLTVTNRI